MTPAYLMTRSPEMVFIFHTVGFILSGLAIAVLGWLAWRTGQHRVWLERLPPFLLLAGSFGLGAWGSLQWLFEPVAPVGDPFFMASAFAETVALATFAYTVVHVDARKAFTVLTRRLSGLVHCTTRVSNIGTSRLSAYGARP